MKRAYLLLVVGVILIVAGTVLSLNATVLAQDAESEPTATDEGVTGGFLQSYYDAWVTSPHNAADDEAFRHWDEDGEIEVECATCHSTTGYHDYLGVDGSAFGVVDAPAELGTTVNCDACHNSVASNLTSVAFPSGLEIANDTGASRCMVCHQGRQSGLNVDAAIADAGVAEDLNAVSEDLRFLNIHFYAAASTLYGSEVHGGYQYEGNRYQIRFEHAEGYGTCTDCHNPHTLEINASECADCHEGVESAEDFADIRMLGSSVDYDGDGDLEEGIAGEIETLQEMLYASIQNYAVEVVGTPIVYAESYPYFFTDTDGDGEPSEEETVFDNRYNAFSGHLLQAVYNYQVSQKDPGGYAHNAKYHIQLLYDSIESLNAQIGEPVDLADAHRNDAGHFNSTAEAFRHWDEDGEVSWRCSKCHTSEGLPFFLDQGVTIDFEPSNSLSCTTCHDSIGVDEFTLYPVEEVEFPSGAVLSFGEEDPNNMCLNCHQGRESTFSIDDAILAADVGNDEVSGDLNFTNPHYFAAGATLFGTEAAGAYEFVGEEYNGRYEHTRRFDTCTDCHGAHALEVQFEECTECHVDVESVEDLRLIRFEEGEEEGENVEGIDYDGDGDAEEPIADEIQTLQDDLFAHIDLYTRDVLNQPIVYAPDDYPYWYNDLNDNGVADPDEIDRANSYSQWTPTLLEAVYNYLWVSKDPGAYSHNSDYILQILYDSLRVIGGVDAVADYTRPPVK